MPFAVDNDSMPVDALYVSIVPRILKVVGADRPVGAAPVEAAWSIRSIQGVASANAP